MANSSSGTKGWTLADVTEIPALWNVGHDGVVIDEDEAASRTARSRR
jgi:hypothetical protein